MMQKSSRKQKRALKKKLRRQLKRRLAAIERQKLENDPQYIKQKIFEEKMEEFKRLREEHDLAIQEKIWRQREEEFEKKRKEILAKQMSNVENTNEENTQLREDILTKNHLSLSNLNYDTNPIKSASRKRKRHYASVFLPSIPDKPLSLDELLERDAKLRQEAIDKVCKKMVN